MAGARKLFVLGVALASAVAGVTAYAMTRDQGEGAAARRELLEAVRRTTAVRSLHMQTAVARPGESERVQDEIDFVMPDRIRIVSAPRSTTIDSALLVPVDPDDPTKGFRPSVVGSTTSIRIGNDVYVHTLGSDSGWFVHRGDPRVGRTQADRDGARSHVLRTVSVLEDAEEVTRVGTAFRVRLPEGVTAEVTVAGGIIRRVVSREVVGGKPMTHRVSLSRFNEPISIEPPDPSLLRRPNGTGRSPTTTAAQLDLPVPPRGAKSTLQLRPVVADLSEELADRLESALSS